MSVSSALVGGEGGRLEESQILLPLYFYQPSVLTSPWHSAAEKARLDVQDLAYVQLMHGKVFQAAVPPNIKRVLDVGCGTGIVTRYFGRSFPSADVYGIDLSPGDTPRTLSPFLPVSERIQEVWNSELWHSLQTFPNPSTSLAEKTN